MSGEGYSFEGGRNLNENSRRIGVLLELHSNQDVVVGWKEGGKHVSTPTEIDYIEYRVFLWPTEATPFPATPPVLLPFGRFWCGVAIKTKKSHQLSTIAGGGGEGG